MARLIDANAILQKIQLERNGYLQTSELTFAGLTIAKKIIEEAPIVDAVEVVHGRWKRVEVDLGGGVKTHRFACSECDFLKNTLVGNYCPNCGADMRGSEK